MVWCTAEGRREPLAKLLCKCGVKDGISKAVGIRITHIVAVVVKTPGVFKPGLLGLQRQFQLVLWEQCLCLLSGCPNLADHSDVYRYDL